MLSRLMKYRNALILSWVNRRISEPPVAGSVVGDKAYLSVDPAVFAAFHVRSWPVDRYLTLLSAGASVIGFPEERGADSSFRIGGAGPI
jgi:hypothetical protein